MRKRKAADNEENKIKSLLQFHFHMGTDRAECKTTLELSLAGSLGTGNVSADLS